MAGRSALLAAGAGNRAASARTFDTCPAARLTAGRSAGAASARARCPSANVSSAATPVDSIASGFARCAAPRQLRSLLTGPDGEVRPELVPVLGALAASNPHSLLIRLRNPGTPLLLRASAAESGPVTHEVLDRLPKPRSIRYLRAALVSTGVLAERNELLIRFEEWVNSVVEEVQEPEERQVIRAFTAWFYLRRLRRRSPPGAAQ